MTSAQSQDPGSSNTVPGINTTRVVSTLGNGNWTITVKIDRTPAVYDPAYGGMGFFVGNSGLTESMRIEVYNASDSDDWTKFIKGPNVGIVSQGSLSGSGDPWEYKGSPSFLRLDKASAVWTFSSSHDGTTFTTVNSWSDAITADTAGFYFYQITPTINAKASIDYIHVDGHTLPTLDREPTQTTALTETFTDLTAWNNDSVNGGTATVSSGVLSLANTTATGSSGRISSTASYGPDVGFTFRWRSGTSTANDATQLVAGLRTEQVVSAGRWANQYYADFGTYYIGEVGDQGYYLQGVEGATSDVDGAKGRGWWDFNGTSGSDPTTGWVRVRMETVGPFIRYKYWTDGGAEPSTWDLEDCVDEVSRAAGPVSFAVSSLVGAETADTAEITDLVIYELS